MELQVRRSKNMAVDRLRIAVDTKEEFFEWLNITYDYSNSPKTSRLLNDFIDINAKLALEIYHTNPEDIDIGFLQTVWNGENLEYLFTHARELFSFLRYFQMLNDRSRTKIKISDEFAEMLASSDLDDKGWSSLVATRTIPIEILLRHTSPPDRWRHILMYYTDLGDEFLEKYWEKIKYYPYEIYSYQKMSLEFMKAHENNLDFAGCGQNKHMTEEILLYFKDKIRPSNIISYMFELKNISEEFLETITPKYITYIQAYYCAFWFVKDEEARTRLLLKYAAHLNDSYWNYICYNGYLTKEVVENFRDKIVWERVIPLRLQGDISYFWELVPKEIYNNPDKWSYGWLWAMPIDHYLEFSKKDEVIPTDKVYNLYQFRSIDDIKKLYKANKIDFNWPIFIRKVEDIDVDTIRKNLKQFLFWIPGRITMYTIDPILELIHTGEINADNCPLLTTKVNLDILIKFVACPAGIFRFFAKYGTKIYRAIDILKEYQSPDPIDPLEERDIGKPDILWFLNLMAVTYGHFTDDKMLQKLESEDPDINKFIVD